MRVFRHIDELPAFQNAVLTIGTFDGVHIGHKKIISRIEEIAREENGESILITFDPHPRIVLSNDDSVRLLTTLNEKTELLRANGIDNLVVAKFSRSFSEMTPEEYITDFHYKRFQPNVVVIGYDHKFGKNRVGDINFMKDKGAELGFRLEEIPKQQVDEMSVSSTKIRQALQEGNIQQANSLLGHAYTVEGTVVRGDGIGRQLGYPTANLQVEDPYKLIPADGVYAVRVNYQETTYNGMLSIGIRPTFNGKMRTIEVNIFDFDQDIYGQKIKLAFVERIRPEIEFADADELIKKMDEDRQSALAILA
ncbi:MAG: riboflavin biosynthesis protein RibF [Bacteroidetes bacterium SW_11_45_7]|nr:MAG: riboflavin biosynthesis protein RibF [Bacteroidetes bacterium SW_11_45_7]